MIETLPLLELRNITNEFRNIELDPKERVQEEPVNQPNQIQTIPEPVSQNNVAPSVLSTGTVNKDNTVSATRVLAGTNPLTQLIAERQSANT